MFYLGTHETSWLARAGFPLFISRRRLALRKAWPRAAGPWALDSGGFTILDKAGEWDVTPAQYVAIVRRCRDEIGWLDWAAPMDWMCEPRVRRSTGLTVAEHQCRTVANYLELRTLDSSLPFIPVLQGWTMDDYRRCAGLYDRAGVDLTAAALTGLGSVCRRQSAAGIGAIVSALAMDGLRLHGFGVKMKGLAAYGPDLVSADSMAWSVRGRRTPGCGRGNHSSEASCFTFACAWRRRLLADQEITQPTFWSPEPVRNAG